MDNAEEDLFDSIDFDEESAVDDSQQQQPSGNNSKRSASNRKHFTKYDYEVIVSWLEHPPNFESLFGTSRKTAVGNGPSSSMIGYKNLADQVCKRSNGRFKNLQPKAMKDRLGRYKSHYIKVKRVVEGTGFGLTAEDRANKIYTMQQKRESLCDCYDRMDALFGTKANVEPLAEDDSLLQSQVQESDDDIPTDAIDNDEDPNIDEETVVNY
ncbi:hypothetical protein BGZ72_003211, partial [Mortierella alpina]